MGFVLLKEISYNKKVRQIHILTQKYVLLQQAAQHNTR